MENAKDVELYQEAKRFIDGIYERPSAYKSMAISKRYMDLYKEKYGSSDAYRGVPDSKLAKWRAEKWTDVESYITGKPRPCGDPELKRKRKGRGSRNLPACRPLKVLERIPERVLKIAISKKRAGEGIQWEDILGKD